MTIHLVDVPAFTVVGIPVEGRFEDLFARVPAAWRRLFAAADIAAGQSVELLEVSFPPREDLYREIVGIRVDAHAPTPPGMKRMALPAGRFLTMTHTGPLAGIAHAFDTLDRHAKAAGLAVTGLKLDIGYDVALSDRPHQLYLAVATPDMEALAFR